MARPPTPDPVTAAAVSVVPEVTWVAGAVTVVAAAVESAEVLGLVTFSLIATAVSRVAEVNVVVAAVESVGMSDLVTVSLVATAVSRVAEVTRVTGAVTVVAAAVESVEMPALIKKKTKFSVIYKDIQMGSGAKSYMRRGFLIYEEMHKFFPIYEDAVSHI